jgi:hypothetical protein
MPMAQDDGIQGGQVDPEAASIGQEGVALAGIEEQLGAAGFDIER